MVLQRLQKFKDKHGIGISGSKAKKEREEEEKRKAESKGPKRTLPKLDRETGKRKPAPKKPETKKPETKQPPAKKPPTKKPPTKKGPSGKINTPGSKSKPGLTDPNANIARLMIASGTRKRGKRRAL